MPSASPPQLPAWPRAVLTARGWALLAVALVGAAAGRLFGVAELEGLAAAAAVAVIAAAVYAWRQPVRLEVSRSLHPPQAAPGRRNAVLVHMRNAGSKATPVLTIRDPFDGPGPQELLAPLGPGGTRTWRYILPELRRGSFTLGPLVTEVNDPLGLARRLRTAGAGTRLVVHPRILPLRWPVAARAAQREGSAATVQDDGQEFATLREYVPGDDVRRVHWPSSARTDTLLVREDLVERLGRVIVVVDLRRPLWSPAALEVALEGAASVADDALGRGLQVRLVATDGTDSGLGLGPRHRGKILDELALATSHPVADGPPLPPSAGGAVAGSDHTIVLTSDRASPDDVRALMGRRRRAPVTVVVVEPRSRGSATASRPTPPSPPPGVRLVRVAAGRDFAAAWNEAGLR